MGAGPLGRLLLAVSLAFTSSLTASADLSSHDLLAPGDRLVTRDSATGLDWLDLTTTTGLSWNDIHAGRGGWIADGWRHATTAEVCELLIHAGFAATPCPGPVDLPGAGALMDAWIDTVGDTESDISGSATRETIGWFDLGLELVVGMTVMRQSDADAWVHVDHPFHVKAEAHTYVGHQLVRPSRALPALGGRGVVALVMALAATAVFSTVRADHRRPGWVPASRVLQRAASVPSQQPP